VTETVARPSAAPAIVRRQVAVDGVRFAVDRVEPRRRRRTTPTLLLHGVPETSRMWHPLLQELGRDRIAVAPDLKGLGESELREPYDIPTLVRELAALVLHEVDGPVDVVGHDWGGSLGLVLAAVRPDLVRRLVVINAPFRHIDYSRAWHMPFFALPVVPELAYALGGRALVRRMLAYGWRSQQPIDPDLREHYVEAYADPARVRAMLAYYRGAVRPRLVQMSQRGVQRLRGRPTTIPPARVRPEAALVIWGAADPILPLRIGESVVNDLGPETRFLGLPGVGHFAVDEAPGLVTAAVASFLRQDATVRARSDA
jgi:haloacetate dehalogenase